MLGTLQYVANCHKLPNVVKKAKSYEMLWIVRMCQELHNAVKCQEMSGKWKCCELSGIVKCCEISGTVLNCHEIRNDVILKLGLDIKVIPWTARVSSRSKTSYFAMSKSLGNFSPCSTLLIKFWSSLAGNPQLWVFPKLYNQVPSLSLSRWKILTLEQIKIGWVL